MITAANVWHNTIGYWLYIDAEQYVMYTTQYQKVTADHSRKFFASLMKWKVKQIFIPNMNWMWQFQNTEKDNNISLHLYLPFRSWKWLIPSTTETTKSYLTILTTLKSIFFHHNGDFGYHQSSVIRGGYHPMFNVDHLARNRSTFDGTESTSF